MESNKLSDEDWSIISSSSDVDEDQLTSNSVASVCIESENDSSYMGDKSISSVATLKIPKISSSNSQAQLSKVQGKEKTSNEGSGKGTKVIQNIKFYENLSRLNDSIKKSSNDFYQHIARLKLEQFNNYIQSKDDFETCVKSDSNSKDESVQVTTDSKFSDNLSIISQSFKEKFVHVFSGILDGLENNSEYLFYYFIATIVTISSSTLLYYQYSGYSFQAKEAEKIPINSNYVQRIHELWDRIIYDTEEPTFYLFGMYKSQENTRSVKAFRIYNDFKNSVFNQGWNRIKILSDKYSKVFDCLHEIRNHERLNSICSSLLQFSTTTYIKAENRLSEIYGNLNFTEYVFLTKNSLKEIYELVSTSLKMDVPLVLMENSLRIKQNVDTIAIHIYQRGLHLKKEALEFFA